MSPGQTASVVVRAQNTGNTTWNKTGANPVRLGTYAPIDRQSPLATGQWISPSRPAGLSESTVEPGGTGTFEFPISIPQNRSSLNERFDLLAEAAAWMEGATADFSMQVNQNYSWVPISQYAYTNSSKTTPANLHDLDPGQTIYVGFVAQNTGNTTWYKGGRFPFNTGASRPYDRVSQFSASGWISPSRPANMIETSVPPGGTGTFEFNLKAPLVTGSYKEYFNILSEVNQWLPDPGLYFDTTVQ